MKKILIVDDTEENIDILVGLLKDYDVLVALDGVSAIEIAEHEPVDLILLDILMPGLDGFDTCLKLKQSTTAKDVPIIFITAKTDEDSIEKAYAVGGLDYVTKPFKPKELLARVRTQLQLRELIAHLEHLSSFDTMTGIYNRRKFFELASMSLRDKRDDLYCVMLDIDKFKGVNDTYGHDVGDKVIKMVTGTIEEQLNTISDTIFGRLGGEEFSILMRSENIEELQLLIENIRNKIEENCITIDSGEKYGSSVSVTVSFGVTGVQSNEQSLDELLKIADEALYQAKGSGRNKSIFRD